jgi:hypothetical protein
MLELRSLAAAWQGSGHIFPSMSECAKAQDKSIC